MNIKKWGNTMKKLGIVVILTLFMGGVCLSGCGKDKDKKTTETTTTEVTSEATTEAITEATTEAVDESLIDFTSVCPASWFEGQTEQEILDMAGTGGIIKVEVNEDGTVTMGITEEKRLDMLAGCKETLDNTINGLVNGDEDTEKQESFTNIEYDEDVTEITIYIDSTVDNYDLTYLMGWPIRQIGEYCQIYNKVPLEDVDVRVTFVDDVTGEVYFTESSKDVVVYEAIEDITDVMMDSVEDAITQGFSEVNTSDSNIVEGNGDDIISVTFPTKWFDGQKEKKIISQGTSMGFGSTVVNEDGSVTYEFTEKQQEAVLTAIKKYVDDTNKTSLLVGPDYWNEAMTEITYNEDLSEFEIYVTGDAYTETYEEYREWLYYVGEVYQLINGTDIDSTDIRVKYIDNETGKVYTNVSFREEEKAEAELEAKKQEAQEYLDSLE